MEYNVGAAFKNAVSPLDNNTLCAGFAGIFGQDAAQTSQLLDLRDLDLSLFTVYRPAKWVDGEKYPVVTWGNGTCAQPEGYGALLRYVASQGFVVVAPNSRYAGNDNTQRHGIDFMTAANADPASPYYQRLDLTKIAAMGHSQGGQATVGAATDERVKTAILFNGGMNASKPYLTISGDRDIGGGTAEAKKTEVAGAPKAAFLFYHMIPGMGAADGHLTLMVQPDRVTGPTVAWLKFMLNDDAESKAWFVGADCKLCNKAAEFEYGQNGL
jgi:pimeloyl-ACP methyl ester carboxylesterase